MLPADAQGKPRPQPARSRQGRLLVGGGEGGFAGPVIALPAAPNLIVLTVAGNAFAVLTTPIMVFGLLWLTNSKRLMLPGHTNRWWENLVLLASAVIGARHFPTSCASSR